MRIYTSLDNKELQKWSYAVTFGKFDGLHKGHQVVLSQLKKEAKHYNAKALVISFFYQRKSGAQGTGEALSLDVSSPYLCSRREREEDLANWGVDALLYLKFEEIRRLDYRLFLNKLEASLSIKVVVGSDKMMIGYRGNVSAQQNYGGPEELATYLKGHGIATRFVASYEAAWSKGNGIIKHGKSLLSSTRLKQWIREGEVGIAREWMWLPYRLSGKVIHGKGKGAALGYPTTNFYVKEPKSIVKEATYLTANYVGGHLYSGMTFVGYPYMGAHSEAKLTSEAKYSLEKRVIVETFLLSFKDSVYNMGMDVYFLKCLRENVPITGSEQLVSLLREDETHGRAWFASAESRVAFLSLKRNMGLDWQ